MSSGELFAGLLEAPSGVVSTAAPRSIAEIERDLRARRARQVAEGRERRRVGESAQASTPELELFAGLDDLARRRAEAEIVRGWSAANERAAAREEGREVREPLPVEWIMWRLFVVGVVLDQDAAASRLKAAEMRAAAPGAWAWWMDDDEAADAYAAQAASAAAAAVEKLPEPEPSSTQRADEVTRRFGPIVAREIARDE